MSKPAPSLMTVPEVAQASRTSIGTVREWLAKYADRLPHVKPGKHVLVRRPDLAAFMGVPESDLEVDE